MPARPRDSGTRSPLSLWFKESQRKAQICTGPKLLWESNFFFPETVQNKDLEQRLYFFDVKKRKMTNALKKNKRDNQTFPRNQLLQNFII